MEKELPSSHLAPLSSSSPSLSLSERRLKEEEKKREDLQEYTVGKEYQRNSEESRSLHNLENEKRTAAEHEGNAPGPSSSEKAKEKEENKKKNDYTKEEKDKGENRKMKELHKTSVSVSHETTEKSNGSSGTLGTCARLVIQRVDEATLQVDPVAETSVSIGKGLVVYICFLRGASQKTVDDIVSMLFRIDALDNTETMNNSQARRKVSISTSSQDVDILVIPQASLAGRLKANALQFHTLISKTEGEVLYRSFIDLLKSKAKDEETRQPPRKISVQAGTYGNLQKLRFLSSGPFTTLIEI